MNLNKKKNLKVFLKPSEPIPASILKRLKEVNALYSKDRNFSKYLKSMEDIFLVKPIKDQKDTPLRFFLGGLLEGEGSLNVSAKKLKSAKTGLVIDPEFSVTQHINGFEVLYLPLYVFQTGRISYKSGSNATLVYKIDNRRTLQEKVMPFYEKYVFPYGSENKYQRACIFKKLLNLFDQGAHLDVDRFINEVLPLWDSLRMQKNQSNQSFASLEEAQNYVKDFVSKR